MLSYTIVLSISEAGMSRVFKIRRLARYFPLLALVALSLAIAGDMGRAAQDRYTVAVPGGLALAEFKGYETWEVISLSLSGDVFAVILGNPAMIEAYKSGIPGNGKPFPDGAKMAKIHWNSKPSEEAPSPTTIPGTLHDVDFMAKDSKRFTDSGGWGYGAFKYDDASDTFAPSTTDDVPPQANDAKCGFACHTLVESKDYVFTAYPKR